jgi:hypothetical protein
MALHLRGGARVVFGFVADEDVGHGLVSCSRAAALCYHLLSAVTRGLDPRVHLPRKKALIAKEMDRRVKPGDDG